MSHGKTEARVERLRAELDTAQRAFAQAETIEGECVVDGRDATAATEARRQADDRVRAVEAALSVAIEKNQIALAALKDAHRQATIEVEAAACARVLALGPRFEEVSALVRQLATDAARETAALRVVGGNETYAYGANEIKMQFDMFLRLAGHPFTNNAHVPQAFMKYKTWTDCLEAICGMKARV